MKKLKSILCITFAFILTAIILCACGINNNKQTQKVGTKTTISLAEAKQLIVSALAIDNNQLQTQSTRGMVLHAADASEDNRSPMEKLGRYTINYNSYSIKEGQKTTSDEYNGIEIYHNHKIEAMIRDTSVSLGVHANISYYLADDSTLDRNDRFYKKDDEGVNPISYDSFDFDHAYDFYNALFTDVAFTNVYDNQVTKVITDAGYDLILKQKDLKSIYYYFYNAYSSSYNSLTFDEFWSYIEQGLQNYSQEIIDATYEIVTVSFNTNDEIIKLKYEGLAPSIGVDNQGGWHMISDGSITGMNLTLTKTNQPITKPDWINA